MDLEKRVKELEEKVEKLEKLLIVNNNHKISREILDYIERKEGTFELLGFEKEWLEKEARRVFDSEEKESLVEIVERMKKEKADERRNYFSHIEDNLR